jgi:hypothetical protein
MLNYSERAKMEHVWQEDPATRRLFANHDQQSHVALGQ